MLRPCFDRQRGFRQTVACFRTELISSGPFSFVVFPKRSNRLALPPGKGAGQQQGGRGFVPSRLAGLESSSGEVGSGTFPFCHRPTYSYLDSTAIIYDVPESSATHYPHYMSPARLVIVIIQSLYSVQAHGGGVFFHISSLVALAPNLANWNGIKIAHWPTTSTQLYCLILTSPQVLHCLAAG